MIITLLFQINDNKQVLGRTVIVPVDKETLINNPYSKLKYYYEPKPNSLEEVVNE